MTFYNDIDPKACAWLRELIACDLIPPGIVDCRSITEITPDELKPYTECHFFAGIGGWSLALRWAGWPDDQPVWTGSCPCQPLSCAGQRKGHADERHLWPAFHGLIAKRKPSTIFGEQVASADGREWLAGVRADLEGSGYAIGAADLCAASIGAPHKRSRLFFVAHIDGARLPDAPRRTRPSKTARWQFPTGAALPDGRTRRIPEPGFRVVVDGLSACVDAVRGYGNAIVPQVAAEFIAAWLECANARSERR